MFKVLIGHAQCVPFFLAREEKTFQCKVIDNIVLIEAFVEHYSEFLEQFNSDFGGYLKSYITHLHVGLAYRTLIVLQDAPLWHSKYPNHFI